MNRAVFKENLSKCKMCKRHNAVAGWQWEGRNMCWKRPILRFPLIQRVCSKIKMCGKNMEATTQVISFMIPPWHCVSARSPVLVPAL